ncbi:MAG: hypothetical protein H0T54_05600 [Geodermatophilaceae bacterium]|nr:hypothetical protein [Geodermatophilaceae bacterium]
MAVDRGNPWESDPGPAKNSGWPELFADTPNYRGFGQAVTGAEAFRWHFGPMFYRGRLDGSARVVVVGQEGAQDESLSHRSFTGGTGSRMQHFLRHLGLDRSYLFLNTFVYPIFGQYDGRLPVIGQDLRSPIAEHRNRILDKAAEGDLRMVVAVGKAAKQSIATWIKRAGGTADPTKLHEATAPAQGSLSWLHFLGVVHPGSAVGGALQDLKDDFTRAAGHVRALIEQDGAFLPADPGVTRDLTIPYVYSSDPVPHRDFPFGATPRLGRGATSSNRKDNQRSIQLYSSAGKANAAGASLDYVDTCTGSPEGYASSPDDIAVEPPRAQPRQYDPGPPTAFGPLLMGQQSGLPWPDFPAMGVTAHPSFGVGPIYRGRFAGFSVLVLADPAEPDDVFTGRALTGESGQRLQAFLTAAGLTKKYLILRTVPVDTSDLSAAKRDALVDRPEVQTLHRHLLAALEAGNSGWALLLAVGPGARRLAASVVPQGVPVLNMKAFTETGSRADWQNALDQMSSRTYAKDISAPTFSLPTERSQVPSLDLPYGTPRWMGTSGTRGSRPVDRTTGKPSPDYLKVYQPTWVNALPPPPLSAADAATAALLS